MIYIEKCDKCDMFAVKSFESQIADYYDCSYCGAVVAKLKVKDVLASKG